MSGPKAAFPCRLNVFLAPRAPVGVILRRGPGRWTEMIRWDRRTDRFETGQWFHGRIYGRRCDLSPDGRLFVYFAAKHGPRRRATEGVGEAWTAISRPPYFTALALWPNLGTWYGGGVFQSDRLLRLDGPCSLDPHPHFRPPSWLKLESVGGHTAPWEQRLLRAGWQLQERGFDPRTHRRVGEREVWRKSHRHGAPHLFLQVEDVDFRRYGGPYHETFWLETADDLLPLDGVTWADWDDGGRLLLARDGCLIAARWTADGLVESLLRDFNGDRPRSMPSPPTARRW